MTIKKFNVSPQELATLLQKYPNMGKNSHVGGMAVEIVGLYFKSIDPNAIIKKGTKGADLSVFYNGIWESFEVKGTNDSDICWSKLKVSSKACYDELQNGMQLIRVTDVGTTSLTLYFMKCNVDFKLTPEPRWSMKPA